MFRPGVDERLIFPNAESRLPGGRGGFAGGGGGGALDDAPDNFFSNSSLETRASRSDFLSFKKDRALSLSTLVRSVSSL